MRYVAAFNNPRLTTIRQPLSNMGRIAAQCVLNQLNGSERFRKQITVEPELVVRESTRAVDQGAHAGSAKKKQDYAKVGNRFCGHGLKTVRKVNTARIRAFLLDEWAAATNPISVLRLIRLYDVAARIKTHS